MQESNVTTRLEELQRQLRDLELKQAERNAERKQLMLEEARLVEELKEHGVTDEELEDLDATIKARDETLRLKLEEVAAKVAEARAFMNGSVGDEI